MAAPGFPQYESPDSSGCRAVRRSPELQPGDIVGGKYELFHRLGVGGMGQVWSARNSSTGAEVAIKALLPELASSSDALARFRDEAHAAAKLAHRGIVRIFDLVEPESSAEQPLIVMELLRGHSLAERLANYGPLSIDETLAVALPILSALSHAHGVGVVHRDLKPDNVFLAIEPDGQVMPKLVDFGISQLREWGASTPFEQVVIGTPWYMSPEQARGEEVDARSVVFGVGVLLYECLSGINPFRVAGATSGAYQSWRAAPIATIPGSLWAVIARALAERTCERFSSAAELAEALGDATGTRRTESLLSLLPNYSSRDAPPRVRAVHALGVLAVVLFAAVVFFQAGAPGAQGIPPARHRIADRAIAAP